MKRLVCNKDVRKDLEDLFDSYIYFEGYIYSFEKVDDESLPSHSQTIDDIEYQIHYEFHQELDFNHKAAMLFFRAFMNKLIREVGFKQV